MDNQLSIVFRTDASLDIGTGHVMRCLTLANALRQQGSTCHFICRQHNGNLIDLITKHGHGVIPLEPTAYKPALTHDEKVLAHAMWLGTDWATDVRQAQAALYGIQVDWLIVDHYALDARWESALRPFVQRIMVIDDLADRPHDCDLLLDQNLGRIQDDYAGLVSDVSSLLIGPKYALLRSEFARLRQYSLERRRSTESLRQILVSLGGVDSANVTGAVLDALTKVELPTGAHIVVVMGAHAPALEAVRAQALRMRVPCDVRVQIEDMAQVMADSDLAIGAAGSSSWERCALGLPGLIFVLAENQRSIALALQSTGAAIVLDAEAPAADIGKHLEAFVSCDRRLEVSSRAAAITDGAGCARVLRAMGYGA